MAVHIERGDVWKINAKALSLRLRNRFRVAVDRRRRKQPMLFGDDSYFSSTLDRWLRRFRDFRRDSLPSSSAFYRKTGLVSVCILLLLLYVSRVGALVSGSRSCLLFLFF